MMRTEIDTTELDEAEREEILAADRAARELREDLEAAEYGYVPAWMIRRASQLDDDEPDHD